MGYTAKYIFALQSNSEFLQYRNIIKMKTFFLSPMAVSYTHLDVYKRQG